MADDIIGRVEEDSGFGWMVLAAAAAIVGGAVGIAGSCVANKLASRRAEDGTVEPDCDCPRTSAVIYRLQTDEGVHETRVNAMNPKPACVNNMISGSSEYVQAQLEGWLARSAEQFVKWWIEDDRGNVIEEHDIPPQPGPGRRRLARGGN